MKVEQIIDEMQASLTKLRRHFNLTGTADPKKCFVCGKPADVGWRNTFLPQFGYCKEHIPRAAMKTAGECTCPPRYTKLHPYPAPDEPANVDVNCPVHGSPKTARKCGQCGKFLIGGTEQTHGKAYCLYCYEKKMFNTPDLPLNARVAKANGKEVKYIEGIGKGLDGWHYWNPHAHGGARWVLIPRCDKIVDEAMGALEEWRKIKGNLWASVIITQHAGKKNPIVYQVRVGSALINSENLPQAICLAIVAHKEGK